MTDMASEYSDSPPLRAQPSKVPSWILLGFIIGGVFVFLLRREYIRSEAPPASAALHPAPVPAAPPPAGRKPGSPLMTIEAVWESWGHYAIWEGETTQVALWDVDQAKFSDFFEVVRFGDHVYFRSLTRLTRPVVDRGLGIQCPLQFTAPATVGTRR